MSATAVAAGASAHQMSMATKAAAGTLLVLVAGAPLLETWEALLLVAGLLALVFGTCKPGWWRIWAAAGLVIAVIGIKGVLPRADIAEAHNVFLAVGEGEPLQMGLPSEVFESWKAQFDALYPPDAEPGTDRSHWRPNGFVPKALFAQSADAIWRDAKYTRQVDAIDFRTLGEFRGGFANEIYYNWWSGPLRRESTPFYVMYELTPASVGSALAWRGRVFWERQDRGFEAVVHDGIEARTITPEDAGRRVSRISDWLWYFCPCDQSSRLDFRGFLERNQATEGDTQWVNYKPRPFSSRSTGF